MSDIFKAYDIRGIYPDELHETIARQMGFGFGKEFVQPKPSEARLGPAKPEREARGSAEACFRDANVSLGKVVIGGDYRISTPALKQSVIDGLLAAGCEVIDIGEVTTPALIFAIKHLKADGGIIVTASHNPKEHNGMKLYNSTPVPFMKDGGYDKIIKYENYEIKSALSGTLKNKNIIEDYIEFVIRKSGLTNLAGKKIVIDCGNGAASLINPLIFRKLGAGVIELCCRPDGNFPNHPADPSHEANMQDIIETVRETNADFGFAYDGDGDRLRIVTKGGKILDTATVFAVLINRALTENPNAKIVCDFLASQKIHHAIKQKGGQAITSRVGHAFIMRSMVQNSALLGGEVSGHFYHLHSNYSDDDALFATLKFLKELEVSGKAPEDYEKEFPEIYSVPSLRIGISNEMKMPFVEKLKESFIAEGRQVETLDGVKVFFKNGWASFRPSNTEPKISCAYESADEKEFEEIENFVNNIIKTVPRP